MQKDEDKIIIYRNGDREMYNLVSRINSTRYGMLKFDNSEFKEIEIKRGKPVQVIIIEKSILLD